MTRHKDAGEPSKFLGHGYCENQSRSVSLPTATDDSWIIQKSCLSVLRALQVLPTDLRGLGIQVTKLSDASTQASNRSLFQYTKTMTPSDLHQRDENLVKRIENKSVASSSKRKSKKKKNHLKNITSFLDPVPKAISFDSIPTETLPLLPHVSLDVNLPGSSGVASVKPEVILLPFINFAIRF